jgi:hypothetical protein
MADSEPLESSESFIDSIEGLSESGSDIAIADSAEDATVDRQPSDSSADDVIASPRSSSKLLADFNIFNAMLLTSLLFILLATFFLFWELAGYGGLDGSWRTGSVGR